MKIVILERNSVGTDVSVDCISDFGEVTIYRNTVTLEEVRERVKDADIVTSPVIVPPAGIPDHAEKA